MQLVQQGLKERTHPVNQKSLYCNITSPQQVVNNYGLDRSNYYAIK